MAQAVIIGVGGTIESTFVGRRPASCTVTIRDNDGDSVVTGAGTVDTVNTTITAAAAEGDTTLTVASAAGIATRRRYLLGDEELTVKSVASLVLTLNAPLERNHASGTALQGLRVTFAVTSLVAAAEMLNGRATFVPDSGDPQSELVEFLVNKVPENLISEVDIRKVVPKNRMALSDELDLPQALRDARDNMVLDMGGRHNAHTRLGVEHLRRIAAYRFWLDRATEFGGDWQPEMVEMRAEYQRLLGLADAQTPSVAADGVVTSGPGEGAFSDLTSMWQF